MPVSFSVCEGLILSFLMCLYLSLCVKAFVVAEAYGKTVDWSDGLLAHVLLSGDMRYLQEFKTYVKLTPSLIESTLYKWVIRTLCVKFTLSHNICVICKSSRPSSNSLSSKILFTSMSSITFRDMICKLTLFIVSALSTSTNNKNLKIDLELTSFSYKESLLVLVSALFISSL